MKDLYKVLNVGRTASPGEIKKAYRKLAKQLHPDLNPGNTKVEQQFKELSQAYSILGDADKRQRYDRGEIDASGQDTAGRGGFYRQYAEGGKGAKYSTFDFGDEHGLDDIFTDLFGGGFKASRTGARRTVRRRGANVTYKISVDFLDAARGAKKRVTLTDGKTLDVTIPPGTEEGQTLRLKTQGMAGLGGAPAGDAFFEVHVEAHPLFTRKGKDIHLEMPVSLEEAVLGASIQVPTVHGKVAMKVPAGANSGTILRLKGKGVAGGKSGEAGDQYVKLRVVLPDQPDQDLKDFIERWGPSHRYDPRQKAGLG